MKKFGFPFLPTIHFSSLSRPKAFFALLALTLTVGCAGDERASGVQNRAEKSERAKEIKQPELKVIEDEAMLKGPQAIIGGIIENASGEKLENLVVELELSGRGGGREVRQVPLKPETLSPGEAGKYTLTVSNHDWAQSKILRIKSSSRAEEVAFISQPGARRPPERPPENKTVIIQRPPRPKGEEFLNTPDSAEPVP